MLPFPTYDLSESDTNAILEIYNTIRHQYDADFELDFTFEFAAFEAFRYDTVTDFRPVISLKKSSGTAFLGFVEVSYGFGGGRFSSGRNSERQPWGIALLKRDYGHIYIKPETISEEFQEFLHPVALDFPDDVEFNRKMYVLANDELKARNLIDNKFCNRLMQLTCNDLIVEILGNRLIIGNKKVIPVGDGPGFADFAKWVSDWY